MLLGIYRTLAFLWPFLREVILGEKTLKEAVRKHKKRLFLIILVMVSVLFNVILIPRVFQISKDYLDLKKRYDMVLKTCDRDYMDNRMEELVFENSRLTGDLRIAQSQICPIDDQKDNPPVGLIDKTPIIPNRKKDYIDFYKNFQDPR